MKTPVQLADLEATLQVVLDEALEAAHAFEQKVKRLRDLKPTDPDYEGRYGELAASVFLAQAESRSGP
jgi:hypothetical protein